MGFGRKDDVINLLCYSLHKPSAESACKSRVDALKEKMLLLSVDEYREAIAGEIVIGCSCRSEVPHHLDREGSSISPCDRSWQHISGGIKLRCYLHIDTFGFLLFGHGCHLVKVDRTSA